eukprot:3693093-Pyramimonas_sp.AAC.1
MRLRNWRASILAAAAQPLARQASTAARARISTSTVMRAIRASSQRASPTTTARPGFVPLQISERK